MVDSVADPEHEEEFVGHRNQREDGKHVAPKVCGPPHHEEVTREI